MTMAISRYSDGRLVTHTLQRDSPMIDRNRTQINIPPDLTPDQRAIYDGCPDLASLADHSHDYVGIVQGGDYPIVVLLDWHTGRHSARRRVTLAYCGSIDDGVIGVDYGIDVALRVAAMDDDLTYTVAVMPPGDAAMWLATHDDLEFSHRIAWRRLPANGREMQQYRRLLAEMGEVVE